MYGQDCTAASQNKQRYGFWGRLNSDALYTMLLTMGYLTMVDYPDPYEDEVRGTMHIPNEEIRLLFKREVMKHLSCKNGGSELLDKLTEGLLEGNA